MMLNLQRNPTQRVYVPSLGENWELNTGQEMGFATFPLQASPTRLYSRKITNGQAGQVLHN